MHASHFFRIPAQLALLCPNHMASSAHRAGCITVFGIWMSDGNQLPPAGETACPTYFAKRLMQQGGAGGVACRSNGHNQWSASKMNKFPKTVKHPVQLRNKTVLRAVGQALGLSRDKFRSATEARV